jgi:TonB family protein
MLCTQRIPNAIHFPRFTVYSLLSTSLMLLVCCGSSASARSAYKQPELRLAVVDFRGDRGVEISALLLNLARQTANLEMVDEGLVRVAARGAGFSGELNLHRDQARAFGQSLGCDYFLLGKSLITRRLETGENFHMEASAGVFLVETRSGRLVYFDFLRGEGPDEATAFERLSALIRTRWTDYSARLREADRLRQSEVERIQAPPSREIFLDADAAHQPVFYQRLKPAYTETAELADVAATVELEADFGDDGAVGRIEVIKWAGYGLDESAIETLKQLRFKPAERDGKLITIRGLVRYNFRRPRAQAGRPTDPKEIERLRQSLQQLKRSNLDPGNRQTP